MRVGKLVAHGLVAATVLLSSSGQATAAQWYKAGFSQAILMGLGMVNSTTGFVSGGRSDGHSNVLKTTDGGKSFQEVPTVPAVFQLGLAVVSEETALVTGVGLLSGGCQYLMDHGSRFNDSAMSNIAVQMSQDAQVVHGCSGKGANRTVAAIGRFQEDNGAGVNVNGYALSADGGATFQFIDIGQNQTLFPARYGSFPDCQTAFITTGTWPEHSGEHEITHHLSQHASSLQLRKGSRAPAAKPHRRHSHRRNAHKSAAAASPSKTTVWSGSIARTTDGGKTFQNLLVSNSFYFNQIACPSVRVCFAVAENEDDGFVFSTRDGGNSWRRILSVTGTSLMSVSALSEEEVYIAGGVLAETGISGKVFVSTDGGSTFTTQTSEGFYFTKVQMMSSEIGFATATDQQQQSDVLVYY